MSVENPQSVIVSIIDEVIIIPSNISHVTKDGDNTVWHTVSDKNDDISVSISFLDLIKALGTQGRYPNDQNIFFVTQ